MLPMPATVRWSSSASPIGRASGRPRAGARRNAALVEALAEDVRAEAGEARVGAQRAPRVISSSTGPSNCTTSVVRRRAGRARPGAATARQRCPRRGRPRPRSCAGASAATRPPSKCSSRCLPRASTPRPRGRRGAPASDRGRGAAAACGSRSGTGPASTGRMRFAAWWIVSPSGIARQALSVSRRGPAPEAERDESGSQRAGRGPARRRPARARAAAARPARDAVGERRRAPASQRRRRRGTSDLQRAAAALDVAATGSAADEHDVGAGDARRRAARSRSATAAPAP